MENRNLNWIIFIIVVLIIIFATLAIFYNPNLTGFLGFGNKQTSTNRMVVVMPIESSRTPSSSATPSNTQDGGVIRLFYVSGQSQTTGQIPTQTTQTAQATNAPSQATYNQQSPPYVTLIYNSNVRQESYTQPTSDTLSSYVVSQDILEKQLPEIQYVPVEYVKVVYVDRESEQSERSSQNNAPQTSNFNIRPEQLPVIPSAPATHFVDISHYAFYPSSKIITLGDSVTWINNDWVAHTVTSDSGGELNSRVLQPGESYTHTFNSVGTFYYHCNIHSFMRGVIIVSDVELRAGHIPFLGNQQYVFRG